MNESITLYDYQYFFKELASNIVEMEEEKFRHLVRDNFADKMKHEIHGDKGLDPLSFFAMLSTNYGKTNPTYEKAKQVFELESSILTDFTFPHADSRSAFFFSSLQDLNDDRSKLCWEVFYLAQAGKAIGNDIFQQALDIPNVALTKLTQILFLINPDTYFPIDDTLTMLSYNIREMNNKIIDKDNKDNSNGYDEYCKYLKEIKDKFPGCSFVEINRLLYSLKTGNIKITNTYYIIDTKVYGADDKDYIEEFYDWNGVWVGGPGHDNKLFPLKELNKGDVILIRTGQAGAAIAIVLDNEYQQHDGFNEDAFIKVIWINKTKKDNVLKQRQGSGYQEAHTNADRFKDSYPETFKMLAEIRNKQNNKGEEIMKEEQQEQEQYTLPHLNTILYGPPGTGKTYHTIKMAAEIIEKRKIEDYNEARKIFQDELSKKEDSRIVFTTFHQNYGYEDFIQGIKPDIQEGSDTLKFRQKDGIFKRLVDKAQENVEDSKKTIEVLRNEEIFNDALAKFIEEKENEENEIDNDAIKKFIEEKENEENEIAIEHTTLKICEITKTSFKYRGPSREIPGTLVFKHLKQMYVEDIKTKKDIRNSNTLPEVVKVKDFSGYYNLYKMIEAYIKRDSQQDIQKVELQNYVIIIDEINRANISRVFGELITLIEPDKRLGEEHALSVTLPSGDEFAIPSNLYIIGTMNTADKSIALLDVALRRRFEFLPMYPLQEPNGKEIPEDKIHEIEILRKLNEEIKQDKGPDFQIGHSYFMNKKFDLETVMNTKVIPLLLEYYRNDIGKVWEIVYDKVLQELKDTKDKFDMNKDIPLKITKSK